MSLDNIITCNLREYNPFFGSVESLGYMIKGDKRIFINKKIAWIVLLFEKYLNDSVQIDYGGFNVYHRETNIGCCFNYELSFENHFHVLYLNDNLTYEEINLLILTFINSIQQ